MFKKNESYKRFLKMHKRHRKEQVKRAKNFHEWMWWDLHDDIIQRIEHMLEYYKAGDNVWQCEESRIKIILDLEEILNINKQIIDIEQSQDLAQTMEDYQKEQSDINKLYLKMYKKIGQRIQHWFD